MPTYEYRCPSCGHVNALDKPFEQRNNTPTCNKCDVRTVRTYTHGGITFKGSGFHKNDYGSK